MKDEERQHDAKQSLSELNNPVLVQRQRHKQEQTLLLNLWRNRESDACMGKRNNMCMPDLGTCIASTAPTLTLRA